MTGQEERDVLFARLFGLTAVIRSGLLLRDTPLPASASSATFASSLTSYKDVLLALLALGEKKSWLRESAWWSIGLAVDSLGASTVPWKDDAFEATISAIYLENKIWFSEKVALTVKLQSLRPDWDWHSLLSPTFKQSKLLNTANLTTLAKILKVHAHTMHLLSPPSHSIIRNQPWTAMKIWMYQTRALGSLRYTSSGIYFSTRSSPILQLVDYPKAPSRNFSGLSLMAS